jgi:hypothetical protein
VGRGGGRGPAQLRFRALLDCLADEVKTLPDARREDRIQHGLADFYLSAFAMFYMQDSSLLEFQRRVEEQVQRNNLRTVFGIKTIPSDTQLREILDWQEEKAVSNVFREVVRRLQRSKQLERYRYLEQGLLITMDGSEYFNSEKLHCRRCLKRNKSDGSVEFYHQIVQPAIVNPELHQVLPLAPQFIRKQDGASKQDSETQAGKRLVAALRNEHPQLKAVLVGDSLYSTQPFIFTIKAHRFSFLLVAKPDDHKHLFADVDGLRRGGLLQRLERPQAKDKLFLYEWINQIPLGADPDSPLVNFVQLTISDAQGRVTYRCSWVSDLPLDAETVEKIVRAARARWKIENEGFNTLKNQGYHLEHNFGHGHHGLSEILFLLNLLAFLVHQIQELVDVFYQQARARFSARVEFWNAIRGSFRVLLFNTWDEVLARINGPPLPAFPQSTPSP